MIQCKLWLCVGIGWMELWGEGSENRNGTERSLMLDGAHNEAQRWVVAYFMTQLPAIRGYGSWPGSVSSIKIGIGRRA